MLIQRFEGVFDHPQPELPGGIFKTKKSQFSSILEGLSMEDVGIFYGHFIYVFCGHMVYFEAIWYIYLMVIWYIYPVLFFLYQGQSGNHALNK
jgi:hypothetical protein